MSQIKCRIRHRWVIEVIPPALYEQDLQLRTGFGESASSYTSRCSTTSKDDVDVTDGIIVCRHKLLLSKLWRSRDDYENIQESGMAYSNQMQ